VSELLELVAEDCGGQRGLNGVLDDVGDQIGHAGEDVSRSIPGCLSCCNEGRIGTLAYDVPQSFMDLGALIVTTNNRRSDFTPWSRYGPEESSRGCPLCPRSKLEGRAPRAASLPGKEAGSP
jgi:hypothetical protein